MSDTELKLALTLMGLIGAIISAIIGVFVFFWMDGRRRYHNQLSGIRVLIVVIESISANIKAGAFTRADLRLDWFISHADTLLRDEKTFNLVRELIGQVASVQKFAEQNTQQDIAPVISKIEYIGEEAKKLLKGHLTSFRRVFFFGAKAG
jgi:hypothetical protein